MSRLKGAGARLRSLLRPASAEQRMEEEFAFHVEMETTRLRAEGLTGEEARRRALASFGGFDRYREEMREGRPAHWLHDVRGDLRFGARMLWKSKGLTAVALLSLALGIGANAAIFSIVDSILLRPRAVARPDELVALYKGHSGNPYESVSYPSYLDFRERNEVFTGLAAYGLGWQFKVTGTDDVELVWGEVVSGNYFDVLGVRAYRGRTFVPEEDRVPSRNPVVVIGHALWQRRFASDPGLVGTTITLNNQPVTVVGIAPPQYTGMMGGWASEIWVPAMMAPALDPSSGERLLTHRGNSWVTLVGRMKPGTKIEQVRARFALLTKAMQAEQPDEWLRRRDGGSVREYFVSVVPEKETRVHPGMRAPMYGVAALMFGVVDLVLVIACMNLASVLFARAIARRPEIAVRLALGATRPRLIRQLLTESVLLSLVAGAAGALLAFWGLYSLIAFMPALPEGIRVAVDIRLDWRVVAYTTAFSTVTGLLFGLAPALHSSRPDVSAVLKDDAFASGGPSRTSRARRSLIVAQVAFSLVLLIGAGLVLRSLEKVRPTRLGFESDNILVAPLVLDEHAYDREKSQAFHRRISEAIAALPAVQAVSLVDGMPGRFMGETRRGTEIEGYTASPGESLEIEASVVGPGYFTNMHVPMLAGRDFDHQDREGAPCVAIVNEVFATRYLGGTALALGKHLAKFEMRPRFEKRLCRIVGVVRDDEWHSLRKEVRPFYALALLQSDERRTTLLVSAAGDPNRLTASVRETIRTLDPTIPVTEVQTLSEYFGVVLYPFRLVGVVIGACGVMALLLAAVGIYGTVSYSVAQRRREVGIRMALGAPRTGIVALVVGQGMRLVGYGLGLGLLLGAALSRVLMALPVSTELFGVSASDALTYAVVTLALALVGMIACYVPATRAARVDPAVTLRSS